MLSDTIKVQDASDVPESGSGSGGGSGGGAVKEDVLMNKSAENTEVQSSKDSTSEAPVASVKNDFPPPKTDKPRPHVCGTCNRSFARLEHLKRHERSHTKEKPFECPECTRCFARRDLLLRHQQKLHLTTTPSSRPRSGRRESTSSSAGGVGKARKGSMVHQSNPASMRPRANTISHVDGATLGFLAAANSSAHRSPANHGHSTHPSLSGFGLNKPAPSGSQRPHGLSKIDTNGLNIEIPGGLRTAPAFGGFPADIDMSSFLYSGPNTVNPAQLHFADSPQSMAFDPPLSPFQQGFAQINPMDDDSNFEWINGFNNSMTFDSNNEHAIAGSSPSAVSTGSPGGGSEPMLDGSQQQSQDIWQSNLHSQGPLISDMSMDMNGTSFPDVLGDTLSPKAMDFGLNDTQFNSPKPFDLSNPSLNNLSNPSFSLRPQSDSPLTAPSISGSSNRQGSVTSSATDTITDATRNAIIAALSQPGPFGHRKYSQPTVSSPLSPGYSKSRNGSGVNLPSIYDFQRYIAAYIKYFHPRLPFLHIPTLSFEQPTYGNHPRMSPLNHQAYLASGGGDGGCLILSMAAIGALFEFDYNVSRELFDAAKKLIQIFLEERRRADMSAAINLAVNNSELAASNTPLWLVQSMLLNVVYGHNCGDRTSADIASTHCAALVSLARAAGLAKAPDFQQDALSDDIQMANDGWNPQQNTSDDTAWYLWKATEERKRTLYSIFVLSSMLVSTYNFPPCLTNSEIRLDLPCDEDLWAADSPTAWYALGGSMAAKSKSVSFAVALSSLLTASQRHPFQHHQISASSRPDDARLSSPNLPNAEFHASDFGCLVLIIALHNYIWETRQRHLGRQWTHQETEAMQAHIGPALRVYQAVWRESPHHNVQRPNPYGVSDLSADCVPWLDLAYVRLFVALGRSKECFWHRNWDGMAHEIARGCEIVQHAGDTSDHSSPLTKISESHAVDIDPDSMGGGQSSKRERHLRKAASHATHSLCMSDKFNVSLADFPSREMSIGSAMCANDSAQVVAEWISTVQERVGPFMGVLGRDNIDYEGVPAVMLLEQEDLNLLSKIDGFVNSMETKLATQAQNPATHPLDDTRDSALTDLTNAGLACKLLSVTARMCESGGTWSVMHLMARSLESQAEFMKLRAEKSLVKDTDTAVEG